MSLLKSRLIRKRFVITILSLIFIAALFKVLVDNPFKNHEEAYEGRNVGDRMAFIIPGMFESEEKFRKVEQYFSDVGITPIFIQMNWMNFNFDRMVSYGDSEISTVESLYPGRDVYFFGFSMGAVVALNTAEKYDSKGTIICSLSPVFYNDEKKIPAWFKDIVSFPSYKKVDERTTLFLYGDHDNFMIRNDELVKKRESMYNNSRFKEIKGAEHDITGEAYLEEIRQEINKYKAVYTTAD